MRAGAEEKRQAKGERQDQQGEAAHSRGSGGPGSSQPLTCTHRGRPCLEHSLSPNSLLASFQGSAPPHLRHLT